MKVVPVIQARMGSTRLPGKVLLPVAGYPSAVLAGLRAGNLGHEVVVATSNDPSDDGFAEQLCNHSIRVFRGPLDDVLGRYHLAAADLSDDCIVVRLTGDNVVPDGLFVRELASALAESGLEYLRGNSVQSRLPYGLAGEAFTVAALRKAHAAAISPSDREHVGLWMARNCRSGIYIPRSIGDTDYSHLRCTIDDEEDYKRILCLFQQVTDPIHASWRELMHTLASLPGEPTFRVPYRVIGGRIHGELTLGTVQLGMKYGIVNRAGKPSNQVAIAMVRHAIAHGVTALDTARSYGDAEPLVCEALSGAWRSRVEVITKLDPLPGLSADASSATVRDCVDESVKKSCAALATNQLSTLLLHSWHHYRWWGGAAWRRLLELRDDGTIASLGASVYEPAEALEALRDPVIQHLQIPLNILDRRWQASGLSRAIADRPDVVVHARSSLLQGILVNPAGHWPPVCDYDSAFFAQQIGNLVRRFDRESAADLCLAYVRSQPWVTSVVVGCETMSQLQENLELFRLPKLTEEQCDELEQALPLAPEALLNPAKWNLAHEESAAQR
jgi:aryl-alcohol dehydrogenase-like predicted oxidoreductase/spore coat polysaccharide biosynthesis protein SpsF (cytidylyltransferase family)